MEDQYGTFQFYHNNRKFGQSDSAAFEVPPISDIRRALELYITGNITTFVLRFGKVFVHPKEQFCYSEGRLRALAASKPLKFQIVSVNVRKPGIVDISLAVLDGDHQIKATMTLREGNTKAHLVKLTSTQSVPDLKSTQRAREKHFEDSAKKVETRGVFGSVRRITKKLLGR